MKITHLNYKLETSDNNPGKFDLIRIGTSKKKDSDETYEIDIVVGYGYTLESAIQKMIYLELEKKNEVLTLKEYLKEFSEMKNKFVNDLNEVLNVKSN